MPENQQPPLQPSPPQQPPPDQNDQSEKQPVDPRFQNYSNLRQKIQTEFINRYKEELTKDLEENLAGREALLLQHPDNQALRDHVLNLQRSLQLFTDQIENASFILAQRTIKLLPSQLLVTRVHIKDALIEAQDELTQNEFWFDAILPSKGKRKKIADTISNSFDLASSPQRQLVQKAIEESKAYEESFDIEKAPTQEEVFNQIQQAAQEEQISKEKSEKIAKETTDTLESKALKHGAEVPEKQQISIIEHIVEIHGGVREPAKAKQIAENIYQKTKPKLKLHLDTIANKRFKIIKEKGLFATVFNLGKKYGKFKRVNKVRGTLKFIRHPVRTVTGKIFRPIISRIKHAAAKPFRFLATKALKAVTKGLIKIGLGGAVKLVSSAALASTGVGVPLAVAKNGILGIIGTTLGILKDWIKTIKSFSLTKPLQTAKKLTGTIFDTAGAAVGGGVGAAVGAVGGTIGGAIAGFFAGGIGAIPGAILGFISGTIGGAGFGASFGYKIRKQLKNALALLIALKLFGKELLLTLGDMAAFAIPGAIIGAKAGAALGALICAPIGPFAIICSAAGGLVGGAIGGFGGAILGLVVKPVHLIADAVTIAGNLASQVGQIITLVPSGIANFFGGIFSAIGGFVNKLFGAEAPPPAVPELTAPITKPIADAVATASKQTLSTATTTSARFFNTATGITKYQAFNIAHRTQTVLSEITTVSVPNWLAASPLMALGLIGAFALITYTVLLTAFYVHPTELDPYVYDDGGVPGSKFIQVQKTAQATVNGTNFGPSSQLTLPNPNNPFTITYTIIVTAVDNDLSDIKITDGYSASGTNNPPTPGSQTWNLDSLVEGGTWTQTVSLNIPIIGSDLIQWNDALLLNTVTVSATVNSRIEQSTAINNITLGQPPSCPPSLSPIQSSYYVSGYRYTNNGISCASSGISHPGIDLNTNTANNTLVSSFACDAQVVYAGADPGCGSDCWLGWYVVLRSGSWYAFYAHMQPNFLVNVGDTVGPGDPIGFINASGNSKAGAHLHYEIRQDPGVNPASSCQAPLAVNPCNFGIAC